MKSLEKSSAADTRIKRLLYLVLGTFALLILLFAARFIRSSAPLSKAEVQFVGTWDLVDLPDETFIRHITFERNRILQSGNDEFRGRWWIENGKLHLKAWHVERTYNPFPDAWQEWNAEIETWFFKVDKTGDQIPISRIGPNAIPNIQLIRKN